MVAGTPGSPSSPLGFFAAGDGEEFYFRPKVVGLYGEVYPALFAYLVSRGLDPDEAADAIQEAFLRLVELLREGGAETNLRAWIFRVAHNLSMDVHRYSRRFISEAHDEQMPPRYDLCDSASDPEQSYLRMEESTLLRKRLLELTSQQRSSILLRAEGMRYREIAKILGVSLQRAADLVQVGLARLAANS